MPIRLVLRLYGPAARSCSAVCFLRNDLARYAFNPASVKANKIATAVVPKKRT